MLQSVNIEEKMNNIRVHVYDINNASLSDYYGFITCTVTLMFIYPARVDALIGANALRARIAQQVSEIDVQDNRDGVL